MALLPKKLKHDAIMEAVVEIRFESGEIPEILLGKLADDAAWRGMESIRLPFADMPATLRLSDVNLRFQPLVELRDGANSKSLKIGTHVMSFHIMRPYCGWERFRPQIAQVVNLLFEKAPKVQIKRLGMRYLNALVPEHHFVSDVLDLNLNVEVAGEKLTVPFNLNFTRTINDQTECLVRIASPKFVEGALPRETAAFVDVDVFTPNNYRSGTSKKEVVNWIDAAHDIEKEAFFSLLQQDQLAKLVEN